MMSSDSGSLHGAAESASTTFRHRQISPSTAIPNLMAASHPESACWDKRDAASKHHDHLPNTSNLRSILKAATAAEHAASERTGVLQAFTSAGTRPALYADDLARPWRLHRAIEPTLRRWLDAGWADARLARTRWLEEDLATLHLCPAAGQIAWEAPCNFAQALGTLYVLEGTTLGIPQSARALPTAHPAHGPANRFVLGYGEHTGARWMDLVARLEEVDPVHWPDVVIGAVAAFRAFEVHFSDRSHAEFDASISGWGQPRR